MVEHFVCGLKVDSALMIGLDRLGVVVQTKTAAKSVMIVLQLGGPEAKVSGDLTVVDGKVSAFSVAGKGVTIVGVHLGQDTVCFYF